ncbi:MAG: SIMPL domain-containing protein [Treponema sp.]|nr:SIMPL domain-containing protein [Treponema sp.]
MKKIITPLTIVLLGLSLVSCTINKPAATVKKITVSGTGSVSVQPDLLTMQFLVRTAGQTVAYASERNALLTTGVINAINEAGVDLSDITTVKYSITPETPNNASSRYIVTNTISVIIRNEEINSKVIDAAVRNGANGLTSFEYVVTDKTSALRQARTLAIQNAQDAASLLAGASGCKIGEVLEITENYVSSGNTEMYSLAKTASTPIKEGNVSVNSSVTVTFALEY